MDISKIDINTFDSDTTYVDFKTIGISGGADDDTVGFAIAGTGAGEKDDSDDGLAPAGTGTGADYDTSGFNPNGDDDGPDDGNTDYTQWNTIVNNRIERANRVMKNYKEEFNLENIKTDTYKLKFKSYLKLQILGKISTLTALNINTFNKNIKKLIENLNNYTIECGKKELQQCEYFEYISFNLAFTILENATHEYNMGEVMDLVKNQSFVLAYVSFYLEYHFKGFREVMECAIVKESYIMTGLWNKSEIYNLNKVYLIARFCGARWQISYNDNGKIITPLIKDSWSWFARVLNNMPENRNIKYILYSASLGVLETAGRELNFYYRENFLKIIYYIKEYVFVNESDIDEKYIRKKNAFEKILNKFIENDGKSDLPALKEQFLHTTQT